MNLEFIKPQNLGSLLMKSSQSNFDLRSPSSQLSNYYCKVLNLNEETHCAGGFCHFNYLGYLSVFFSFQIASKTTFDPSTPLTLELKHGSQLHKVRLPTENLDKSKKYYVTFTIDKANGLQSDDVMQVKLYFLCFPVGF